MVMGQEILHNQVKGLCNAVILAEPHSRFVKEWIQSYEDNDLTGGFCSEDWGRMSVVYPGLLAAKLPKEITVVPHNYFFAPSYSNDDLCLLFDDRYYLNNEAYCHHLWETLSWPYLEKITPNSIYYGQSTYDRIAKKFIDKEDKEEPLVFDLGGVTRRGPKLSINLKEFKYFL